MTLSISLPNSIITVIVQSNTPVCVDEWVWWKCVYDLACPTIESEGLGECQNSDVPAVVINVSIYKGQVAAVVNDGLHLRHVCIDRFIIDGA